MSSSVFARAGGGAPGADFAWPFFYHYPPYFTLQPVKETREKQSALWCALIHSYCRHHRVFILTAGEDTPLFHNAAINRRLLPDAAQALLEDLVASGGACWLDPGKRRCLVLWRKVDEWAALIGDWAAAWGVAGGGVLLVDELSTGDDTRGSEVHGLPRELLLRALKALELKGKAKLFRGAAPGEEGVKFL